MRRKAAVLALVGEGQDRARAKGFGLATMIDDALFWIAPTKTTPRVMFHRAWNAIVTETPGSTPDKTGMYAYALPGQSPEWESFMAVAYLLSALLLGYLGGRFCASRRKIRPSWLVM